MTLEHTLSQRFEKSTNGTTKLTKKYGWPLEKEEAPHEDYFSQELFSIMAQSSVSKSVANVLRCTLDGEDGFGRRKIT